MDKLLIGANLVLVPTRKMVELESQFNILMYRTAASNVAMRRKIPIISTATHDWN